MECLPFITTEMSVMLKYLSLAVYQFLFMTLIITMSVKLTVKTLSSRYYAMWKLVATELTYCRLESFQYPSKNLLEPEEGDRKSVV